MLPAARQQAAIDVLDAWLKGQSLDQALSRWSRGARYAGSKDRAAVRDHVFDVLRKKGRCAALGGGDAARALVIGLVRLNGQDPDDVFTGQGHAPAPLDDHEGQEADAPATADIPSWTLSLIQDRDADPALIEALTDNRNRTGAEIRSMLTRHGGSLAEPGAVAWQFSRRGTVTAPRSIEEDDLMLVALEAGADDLLDEGEVWRIYCEPTDLTGLRTALEEAGFGALRLGRAEAPDPQAEDLREAFETLSPRERAVMGLVTEGKPNKVIAFDLGVGQRTVEIHRARVMQKMGARNLAELVRTQIRLEQAAPA